MREAGHEASATDCVFAVAQRLATCSSDRVVKIFDVSGETCTPVAELAGHDGPVRASNAA